MGRSRAKGRKQATIATREDLGSAEEEKIPAKKRGRPLKSAKNEIVEKEAAMKLDDGEHTNSILLDKNINTQDVTGSGRKRGASEIKENNESVKEENGADIKTIPNNSSKPVGFRQNGSRRKNKPQRAAEVGVECG